MRKTLPSLIALLATLLVWQGACALFHIPRYIVPTPLEIYEYGSANFIILSSDSAYTALEAMGGFCIGIGISLLVAVFVDFVPGSGRVFDVANVGAQSVPVLAIAPFLTSWFGSGVGSKIAASAIVCVFPLVGGWMAGKRTININEQIFANSVLPTRWSRLRRFTLPRSLPAFVATLKIACPLSVLGALVGEFVGSQRGLGFRILTGSYYLRTEEMACGVILACLVSLFFYMIVALLEKKWLFWQGKHTP